MPPILIFIIIGLVAGFLAGQIWKGAGFGLVGDLIVGLVGALLGGWIFGGMLAITQSGLINSIITATAGALILLFLIKLIKRA